VSIIFFVGSHAMQQIYLTTIGGRLKPEKCFFCRGAWGSCPRCATASHPVAVNWPSNLPI